MRRRAVSHNPKRLPRRLRPAHSSQRDKSGGEGRVVKRPSRRHRRRPKNLIEEYVRRQRPGRPLWLETHLWHAKRFHMSDLWGCKIPHFPNDKAWRACYRAASSKCLMWDFSYLKLIELEGNVDLLLTKLNEFTREDSGGRFQWGPGEGSALLFKEPGSKRLLGEVSFLWKPRSNMIDSSTTGCLWIWCHPGFYQEVIELLSNNFNLKGSENEDDSPASKKTCTQGPIEGDLNPANGTQKPEDLNSIDDIDMKEDAKDNKRKRSAHLARLAPRLAEPTCLLSKCGQVQMIML